MRSYFNDGRIDHVDIAIDPDEVAWTIQPNAVTDGKLRDSAALSVIGRSANSVGDPADIVAANAGEVLRRYGNVVGFGLTLEATLTWDDSAEVRLGTGGDLRLFHDGTDSFVLNETGDLVIANADGEIDVSALTAFVIATGGVERAQFDADGALLLDGDPGTATQVLTSNGAGVPPTWEAGGGGSSSIVIRGASWVSSSGALTSGVNVVYATVPFAGTITKARLLTAGGTGSCVVDVRKGTYAGFPTVASIAAAAKPTITGDVKYEDSTLTGWTTAISAGDILAFVLESTSTFTQITIELELQP